MGAFGVFIVDFVFLSAHHKRRVVSEGADCGGGEKISGANGGGQPPRAAKAHRTQFTACGAHCEEILCRENDRDDLVSIGTVGLIKAVDSFDPTKGIRLSSYASRCIENEILMFFRSAKKTAQDVSLNDPIDTDKDGNTLTLLDTIATDDHILEDIDLRMKVRQLYDAVKTRLSPREREIILLRYGLTGRRPLVQREVAKKLNISRSYVSRLEKKALQKLRKAFDE